MRIPPGAHAAQLGVAQVRHGAVVIGVHALPNGQHDLQDVPVGHQDHRGLLGEGIGLSQHGAGARGDLAHRFHLVRAVASGQVPVRVSPIMRVAEVPSVTCDMLIRELRKKMPLS